MRINHNISALNAYRNLSVNNANTSKSLEKLSSGLRINRAADDAAGLAISEKMRSQIRGLGMAERNVLDGISFIQTAEGALSSTHSILQRVRELAVQAANDSNTAVDREAIQKEINQLTNEINRIGNTTEFNTKKLLNGDLQILGEPKNIKTGSDILTNNLSNLKVDQNSLVSNGNFKIEIENSGGIANKYQNVNPATVIKTGGGSGSVGIDALIPGTNNDIDLDAGDYKIILDKTVGPVAENLSDPAAALNNANGNQPITIDPNSTLVDGTYDIEVTKNRAYNAVDGNGATLSNVTIDPNNPAEAGDYTFTTVAKVSSGASDTYITNVSVSDPSVFADPMGAYSIDIQLTDDTATKATYTIGLKDSNGNLVPDTQIDFEITQAAGVETIKLGDLDVQIDTDALWAAVNHDGTVDGNDAISTSTLNFNVSKTIVATHNNETEEQRVVDGDLSAAFNFSTGNLSLALDPARLTLGHVEDVTVQYEDTWNVKDYTGNTISNLTVTDLTNIQIGNAGDGVQIDLDSAALQSMGIGSANKSTVSFDVARESIVTA
ncbi:hypothetical protein [Bacillus sp. V5-8f]|uniref:flagellin N-terminal helical domain-containing protein n=1 Tax=Bacillus sp. V5-8f TaxID=2053044 RepID=UPI000C75D0FE|nr:hypothetical protein [Bacillus sp. V5-8f]PLT32618.1 hypothetical protein CUU64_18290 [Bacillus sp. V5-8f]